MLYNVSNEFLKISETSGTIQNTSRVFDIEVSDKPVPNSGYILLGLHDFSFSNQTIYLRCIGDGVAEVRVVPFATSATGGAGSSSSTSDDNIADDSDMQNAIDDIFDSGGSSVASDPDIDSAIDDIFNP